MPLRASPRSTISDPVTQQNQDGGRDDGGLGSATVESPDDNRRDDDEGKEESGAEPVDGRLRNTIILRDGS
jgi:hypothetical protein